MAEKKKYPDPITTPIGHVGPFAKLVEYDDYQGQRKYKVRLILDADDAEKITGTDAYAAAVAEAERLYEEAKGAARKKGKPLKKEFDEAQPFFNEVDRDSGEETGRIVFNFGSGAFYLDKKTGKEVRRYVPFFTAKGVPIPRDQRKEPWSGSRVRLSYVLYPYCNVGASNYGVSLRLEAVKVIELKTGSGGQDASRYGFGDEEEGFDGEDAEDTMTSDDSNDDADDGDTPPRF